MFRKIKCAAVAALALGAAPAMAAEVETEITIDIWLGYARVTAHLDGPDIPEDRIWQQASFALPGFLGGSVGGRSRLEQRFRDADDGTGWRFRQFIRWGRRIGDSPFSAVVWDELFVNINTADGVQSAGFDQNRFFVGAAWHIAPNARIEGGYMNNILNLNGPTNQLNHNFSVSLFYGL